MGFLLACHSTERLQDRGDRQTVRRGAGSVIGQVVDLTRCRRDGIGVEVTRDKVRVDRERDDVIGAVGIAAHRADRGRPAGRDVAVAEISGKQVARAGIGGVHRLTEDHRQR